MNPEKKGTKRIMKTPRDVMNLRWGWWLWAGLGGALAVVASAQDVYRTLEPMKVVGAREEVVELPGSAAVIEAGEFRERGYTNIAQIAAKVPSVFVRDEDGFGNFPNLSLRGVNGNRSEKVTLMEDGILTAPSTYAAPAAYYSPKAARMSAIEFLKGSSQVRYGPHTTGGVVNYLSTPIPGKDDKRFFTRATYGSWNTFFNQTSYGGTVATDAGTVGYLLEMHSQFSDGYRDIDGSSADTGFDLVEPMLKLAWQPETVLDQRFELKVGHTDFEANESYAGITVRDLRDDPDRRYAASQFDHHDAEQWRTYLKWVGAPSDTLRFESAAYFNSFKRNWDKLDGLSGAGLRTNVGQALMHAPSLAVLQGFGAGRIFRRDAFRDHEAYGWQNQANIGFETRGIGHELAVGLRLHYDRAGGTNQQIFHKSNGDGTFAAADRQAKTSAGLSETFAKALYIEDEMKMGAFTLRPGVRYEHLDVGNTTGTGVHRSADEHLVMGGLGATYDFDASHSLFGGVYLGASPANPAGYLGGTQSEESLGYELGYRYRNEAFRSEWVAFFTDYDNLIAPEVGMGGGGLTASKNGGSAESMGLESMVEYDFGNARGWTYGLPVYLSATYTNAEFVGMSGSRLGNGAGLFAGAVDGNEIPYIPEWKLAAGVSLDAERWSVNLDTSFASSSWGTGYNGDPRLKDDGTADDPTAIDGEIDSLFLVDLTGHYQLKSDLKLVAGVQNVFDTRKIISRAPLGARANAPRMIFAGFELEF
ncbi:MAG: TonB-dependent receptor [Verrucomicrobia bacterium]|nr:TonB-dependent receptor [Verrucomicrobiota bacterium]